MKKKTCFLVDRGYPSSSHPREGSQCSECTGILFCFLLSFAQTLMVTDVKEEISELKCIHSTKNIQNGWMDLSIMKL